MIITRFAPSPTGYMHIGNIRTALFCWLFARNKEGGFHLRIDDTDQIRNSRKYLNNIVDVLNWLKIDYDKIIVQSKNYIVYKNVLLDLLDKGYLYKCYCDKSRLEGLSLVKSKNKMRLTYDGYCRTNPSINDSKTFVIRFKNDSEMTTDFHDLVRGLISVNNVEIGDFIVARNDYYPTYNFASVVDDMTYATTHIIRGDDHIVNTIKQINIMRVLACSKPTFAHLPMILDTDGKVLSKRDKSSYINYYINNGFLPEAFLNYILRLGWSLKDREIFSVSDMIKVFNLDNISKSAAMINHNKLVWLNKMYIKNMNYNDFLCCYLSLEKNLGLNYMVGPSIKDLFDTCKTRVSTLKELAVEHMYFYNSDIKILDEFLDFIQSDDVKKKIVIFYVDLKKQYFNWTLINIKNYFKNFLSINNFALGDIAFILRIIIAGKNNLFPIYELLFLCGKILILKKIRNIINKKGL